MPGYAAVLYGSAARGDEDTKSDIDVLVVGDAAPALRLDFPARRLSVSHYQWDEFLGLRDYGSPFLHHLKDEGRLIACDDAGQRAYCDAMVTLPPYMGGRRDVAAFRLALEDVAAAAQDPATSSYVFELGVVATVVRHASILGCYLHGRPTYGRYEAVRRFSSLAGLPSSLAADFPALYAFRLAHSRGQAVPLGGSWQLLRLWLHRAQLLLERLPL